MKRNLIAAAVVAFVATLAPSAQAGNIVDDWASVKVPAAPQLKPATVDTKTYALLVIDMVNETCNAQARPRCVETIPAVQKLLNDARAKGMVVIFSLGPAGNNFLEALAPK